MLSASYSLSQNAVDSEMSRSLVLFGDPALKFPEDSFSEPSPPPRAAQPKEEFTAASNSGGGCSIFAGNGHESSPIDSLYYFFEVLCYLLAYRGIRRAFRSSVTL